MIMKKILKTSKLIKSQIVVEIKRWNLRVDLDNVAGDRVDLAYQQ